MKIYHLGVYVRKRFGRAPVPRSDALMGWTGADIQDEDVNIQLRNKTLEVVTHPPP